MKKGIIGFLLVLGALSLRANDSYIYWLQTAATFDGQLPGSEPYSAKFVAINGTEWSYGGGEYLDLWTVADGGIGPGELIGKKTDNDVYLSTAGAIDNMPRYANITGTAGKSGWTYFIELYNGGELFARSDGLSSENASAYIYTSGEEIIKPTSGFSAMTFVPASVPEPTSGLLLLLGGSLLALRRKRA